MSSFASTARWGVHRLSLIASTALAGVMLQFGADPAGAQQSASPDVEIRPIRVTPPPQPARRSVARPATPQRRAARAPAPQPTPQPAPAAAPVEAPVNATIVANSAD